jgi:hypothetical protein
MALSRRCPCTFRAVIGGRVIPEFFNFYCKRSGVSTQGDAQ